jgi:NTP pyrophosphatase (non-canonical NTP hydrolase)
MNVMPTDSAQDSLLELRDALRQFANEREWGRFHSPKNLAIAISVESAELLEHFQWLSEADCADIQVEMKAKIGDELADVLLYVVQLADKVDIDLTKAARDKLQKNAVKYPVDKSRGNSKKYTEL